MQKEKKDQEIHGDQEIQTLHKNFKNAKLKPCKSNPVYGIRSFVQWTAWGKGKAELNEMSWK